MSACESAGGVGGRQEGPCNERKCQSAGECVQAVARNAKGRPQRLANNELSGIVS